jgi:TatD DNase family protein
MRLSDTHCHLDLHKFDEDRQSVLQRAMDAGVQKILIPALDWESSLAVLKLARSDPMLYAAVGFHPTDAEKWEADSYSKLAALIEAEPQKIVAVGEIGLDYYWVKEPGKRTQEREVLSRQLRLAGEVGKPVIIHMREENDAWFGEASEDLLVILSYWHSELVNLESPLAQRPGVLHSFNGTLQTAEKALALNFLIGVTGPVTYKNAEQKRGVIREIPLDRLLIETDAPFLAPLPHRGKRNEPAYVSHIADKIAEIHSKHPVEIAEITADNASRLFAWGD